MAAIPVPRHPNLLIRVGVAISERSVGRSLEPARLLAWYPKAALGFGVMEALVAHHDGRLDKRLLQLVRLVAAFAVGCPFCIDLNGLGKERNRLTDDEVRAVARLAGWKFATLHEDLHESEEIHSIVKRLSEKLTRPYEMDGKTYEVKFEFMPVMHSPQHHRPIDILDAGYKAMLEARAGGQVAA